MTDVDVHKRQLAQYLEWTATVACTTTKPNIMQALVPLADVHKQEAIWATYLTRPLAASVQ